MPQGEVKKPSKRKIAYLETIDFSKLLARNEPEIAKLVSECSTAGFFYLDIQGQSTRSLLEDEDRMYKVMEEYFDQPLETKMEDDRGTHKQGYKPPGAVTSIKDTSQETYETLKIARDEISWGSSLLPPTVKHHPRLFDDLISKSHLVTMTILSILSTALPACPRRPHLEHLHRDECTSNTTLVLHHYHKPPSPSPSPSPSPTPHTDTGSLTLLLTKQWGLQIPSPETQKWEWVAPRPGHAIINVGESLRFLSRNRLVSCVHRVVPASELMAEHRYSIAYFLRPNSDVVVEDEEGRLVEGREWYDGK